MKGSAGHTYKTMKKIARPTSAHFFSQITKLHNQSIGSFYAVHKHRSTENEVLISGKGWLGGEKQNPILRIKSVS